MLIRPAIALAIALLLLRGAPEVLAQQLEYLPNASLLTPQSASEPVVELDDFSTELVEEQGWLARWRADHQRRAAEIDTMIQTDRPSFTYSDATVPKGWLQVESGFGYERYETEEGRHQLYYNLYGGPQLNVRYGLSERIELRVLWAGAFSVNRTIDYYGNRDHRYHYSKTLTSNTQAGFKFQVTQQNGFIPKSALVTTLILPTTNDSSANLMGVLLSYIYTWYLTEHWSLGGSTGALIVDESVSSGPFQSFILRHHWTPGFNTFYELYARSSSSYSGGYDWDTVVDAGIQWRPLQNMQFDWRVGSTGEGDIFTGVGASLRY